MGSSLATLMFAFEPRVFFLAETPFFTFAIRMAKVLIIFGCSEYQPKK
jgi:hypothetical protein